MDLEFTTTAVVRPQIIRRTYQSFSQNLRGVRLSDCRLFLNIDPIPAGDPMDVVRTAKMFFKEVVYHIGEQPNFAAAVKWCWSQPASEYLFHLEDDWILTQTISVEEMKRILYESGKHQIVLRAYSKQQMKIGLPPSLIKKSMYQAYAKRFTTNANPEVQMKKQLIKWEEGDDVVPPESVVIYPDQVVLKDLGRPWLRITRYQHGPGFLVWSRK